MALNRHALRCASHDGATLVSIPRFMPARLRADTSGLALTEFALCLPMLMTLSIGGVEMANYVNANMRASQIALSVADNAGRIRIQIDYADVDSIMIGAKIAGESIKFGEHGRVILSMIEDNGKAGGNAGQTISWQQCFGARNATSTYGNEGDGKDNSAYAAGFGPTGKKVVAAPGSGVMFVELTYEYQPLFLVENSLIGNLSGKVMHYTAAFPVRERTDNVLKNGYNWPESKKRNCARFSAT